MSKPKTFVSQFTLHFGPATTTGQLVPIKLPEKKERKLKMVTPEGYPVQQLYFCQDNEQFYLPGDLARGVEQEDGKIKLVSDQAVETAKTSVLPPNIMTVNAHNLEEVNDHLFPAPNNAYVMQPVIKNQKNKAVPDPVNDKWYDFINAIVTDSPDIVFMGMCNLRNSEALFRLGIYQGHIMVQRMLYPEDLNQYDVVRPSLSETEHAKAMMIAQRMVTPFDVDDYRDVVSERLDIALAVDSDGVVPERQPSIEEEFDLEAALDAFEV